MAAVDSLVGRTSAKIATAMLPTPPMAVLAKCSGAARRAGRTSH